MAFWGGVEGMLVVLAEEGPHEELPGAFPGTEGAVAKESYLPSPILFPSAAAPCPPWHSVTHLYQCVSG